MKGIPKHNNFKVINLQNNEEKEYRTITEISKDLNVNYYTTYEIFNMCENRITKKTNCKLKTYIDKIRIERINNFNL